MPHRVETRMLIEQLTRIVTRLDYLATSPESTPIAEPEKHYVRKPRPPLPDPRKIRRILRQRQMRGRYFNGDLFADPAWDMMLDLAAAHAERSRVSVTSLCVASGVPPTTALRWVGVMTEQGMFSRFEDDRDRRRVFVSLTEKAADGIARYFDEAVTVP